MQRRPNTRKLLLVTAAAAAAFVAAWLIWPRDSAREADARADGEGGAARAPVGEQGAARAPTRAWEGTPDPVGELVLEGQVLDSEDRPVGGVTVHVDTQPERTVITEADGSFGVVGLIERRYRISASGEAGVVGPVEVRLSPTSDPVVLRLASPGRIAVRVVDATTRAPVAGAAVEVRAPITIAATTSAEGEVALAPVMRGHWNVVARAQGFAWGMGAVVVGDDTATLTIALELGTTISGRVRDERGVAIAGARVWAEPTGDWTVGMSAERDGTVSGPDGAFVLDGIAAGAYRVRGRAHGHAPGESSELLVADAPVEGAALVLLDAGVVRGRVVHVDGTPAAGAAVRVYNAGVAPPTTHAAADGSFVIEGLPRQEVWVGAEGGDAACWAKSADLTQGTAELVLRLDLAEALWGEVVDDDGEPVEAAQVDVALVDARARFIRRALTDGGGGFRVSGLPPGEYELVATRPGTTTAPSQAPVRARTGQAVRLVIPAPGAIVGRLAFADGGAPAVFTVQLVAGAAPRAFTDGAFLLDGVAPGTYRVRFEGPELAPGEPVEVVVPSSGQADVGTITVERGRSVEGVAVDASDRPVAGAEVVAATVLVGTGVAADSGSRAPTFQGQVTRALTGADGRFTLRGLSGGAVSVVASHATAGRSTPQTAVPGAEPLRVVLAATGSISGTVRVGGQAGPAVVAAQPHASPLAMSIVLAGADGAYRVPRAAAGRYSVAAVASDPLRGAPLAPVGVAVASGRDAQVDLVVVRGLRALEITTGGPAVVFVTTEPHEARDALALVSRLGVQERGHWAMRAADGGVAHFGALEGGAYTACAVAITEPVEDVGEMLELIARRGAGMPVSCAAVPDGATAAQLRVAR